MKMWPRLVAASAVATLALTMPGRDAHAQRSRTTTTAVPAPGAENVPEGTVVNSWAVAPFGSQDPSQPGDRPFLSYTAAPGSEIRDSVILYNYSNVQLAFRLLATDAFNNVEGQFDVLPSGRKPKDVGKWVTLAQETLSLPPKTQVKVDLTLRIPRGASPGDHTGAILASSPAQGRGPDGKIVNVDRRTGTRIYLRVAGPLTPELAITKVKTTYRPGWNPFSGKNDVSYTIENQGNVRLAAKHRVLVSGVLGLGGKSRKYVRLPSELLPRQRVTLHASFKGLPATFLSFANVELDPDDAEGEKLGVVSSRAATIAMPWTIIALLTIVGLARYAQRAYRRHQAEQGEPSPSPTPA